MRKFLALTRVNFRAMLAALSVGRTKKGTLSSAVILLIFGALALYLSGTYSFLFGAGLSELGLAEFLLPLMAMIGVLAGLLFTFAAAGNILYGGRDADLILSLPVSAFSVMLSKMLSLYLENLVFVGLWLIPAGAAHMTFGSGVSAWGCVRLAVYILFSPLLSALLGALAGWLSALASYRMRRKALWMNLAYLVFFGAIFTGSLYINNLPAALLENEAAVRLALNTWLLPFGLMMRSGAGALLAFIAVCLVPFLAVSWLLCRRYKAILSGLTARTLRKDFRLTRLSARSSFLALYRKEAGRYFGSPIYVFNTLFGGILAVGASVAAVVMRGEIAAMLPLLGGLDAMLPAGAFGGAAVLATICTTAVSVSMEGKTLWILKSSPLPPRVLFGAKAAFNLTLSLPCAAVCAGLLAFAVGLAPAPAVCIALFWCSVCCFVAVGGLWVNLFFPKLDCPNDTLIVKQSMSAFLGIFGGMLAVGAAYLPYWAGIALNTPLYCLALTVLFGAAALLLWFALLRAGSRRFTSLI